MEGTGIQNCIQSPKNILPSQNNDLNFLQVTQGRSNEKQKGYQALKDATVIFAKMSTNTVNR